MHEPIQCVQVPSLQSSFRPLPWGVQSLWCKADSDRQYQWHSSASLQVCRVLHLYLSKAFPDEYEIRDQENRGTSQILNAAQSTMSFVSIKGYTSCRLVLKSACVEAIFTH